jgi:hypothetical protein
MIAEGNKYLANWFPKKGRHWFETLLISGNQMAYRNGMNMHGIHIARLSALSYVSYLL